MAQVVARGRQQQREAVDVAEGALRQQPPMIHEAPRGPGHVEHMPKAEERGLDEIRREDAAV